MYWMSSSWCPSPMSKNAPLMWVSGKPSKRGGKLTGALGAHGQVQAQHVRVKGDGGLQVLDDETGVEE